MKKWIVLVTVLLSMIVVVTLAQAPGTPASAVKVEATAPVAPVLAEVDGLKLENALLKMQNAQVTLDKLKADFQALLTSFTKPGYQIAQGTDGKLSYVAEPKQVEKKEPPK